MREALRQLSPLNLILTPLKQHLGCCVVAPLIVKLAGATVLVETFFRNELAEALFLLLAIPPSIWLILKLEDKWRARHARHHHAAHDHCASQCHPAPSDFNKRLALNLVVAFTLALILHLSTHKHTEIQHKAPIQELHPEKN